MQLNFSHKSNDTNFSTEVLSSWQNILQQSRIKNIFLTPEFQEVWWKHFGQGQPFFMIINDTQGEEIGLVPLFIDHTELHFFGSKAVSDYLDFIVKNGAEKEFFARFIEEIVAQKELQTMTLLSVPETSPTLSMFVELARRQGWTASVEQQTVCPVITLPKTWNEYLAQIGKKQRHEIMRKWRRLEEQMNPIFSIVTDEKNINKDIEDFIRLHKLSSAKKAEFWDEKREDYFRNLIITAAKNGWLKLFFLEITGTRVATMLCFDYNNQFFLYNSGFDPEQFAEFSVGNALTSYTIKTAIELGRSRYDFLRGNEEYKFRYGAVAEPIFDIFVQRNAA
jgi:CelD/BcsL family acetyltransferase involved in cellulose biosynthesis